MKRCLVVLAVGFSLAVMSGQPGYSSAQGDDLAIKHWTGALAGKATGFTTYGGTDLSPQRDGSFLLARGMMDLRDVDWATVKDAKDADAKKGEASVNSDENGNGDDEEAEEDGGDDEEGEGEEEEEAEGGWDRVWDAPKLG